MLQHLHNGYQVDQAILSEEDRVVVRIVAEIPIKLHFLVNLMEINQIVCVSGHPIWSRLGPSLHENGRSLVQYCRESEKLCGFLFSRHHRSVGFQ